MTWKEFKEEVENSGLVKDETDVWFIDVNYPEKELTVELSKEGDVYITDK